MSVRMVHCVKLGRELPGLPKPPFPNELGKRLYDTVSQAAWQMWQQQSTILINHYGLNLADKRAQQFLREQMEEFFFGPGAQMPEGWTPEDATAAAPARPAKGAAPAKGGAPQRKG